MELLALLEQTKLRFEFENASIHEDSVISKAVHSALAEWTTISMEEFGTIMESLLNETQLFGDWRDYQPGGAYYKSQSSNKASSELQVSFSPLFWDSYNKKLKAGLGRGLVDKIRNFVELKAQDPTGKVSASDYKYKDMSGWENVWHAELANNLRILYRIEGNILRLYGVYNHDDLGTSSPPKLSTQRQWGKRFNSVNWEPPVPVNKAVDQIG